MYPEEKREIRNAKDTPSGTRRISKRAKGLSRTLDPKEDAYNNTSCANVSTLLSYSSLPFNEKFLASIIPFDINILQQLISSHEKLRISVRATLVIKQKGIKGRRDPFHGGGLLMKIARKVEFVTKVHSGDRKRQPAFLAVVRFPYFPSASLP